jgi:hypothetical protein
MRYATIAINLPYTTAMFRKKLSCIVLLFISINVFSQDNIGTDAENVIKLTIIEPAVSYEKRIGKLQTLYVQAFADIEFGIGYSSSLGNTSFFYASPAAGLQYRYYYNAARRKRKGKTTEMNSMNYIAPVYNMVLSAWGVTRDDYVEENRRPVHSVLLAWGLQRNYTNRFSIDFNAGAGIVFARTTLYGQNYQPAGQKISSSFAFSIQARIGLWLNPKK